MSKELLVIIPGLATALAAIIGIAGLLFKWHLDQHSTKVEKRDRRRAAFARFYTDVHLRGEYLTRADDPEALTAGIKTLESYAQQGRKFKFYGAQVSDTSGHDLVSNQLHTIKTYDAIRVRRFILLDRIFVAEYEKLQSSDFAQLALDRQIDAYTRWVAAAKNLRTSGIALEAALKTYADLELGQFSDEPKRPDDGA